MSRPVSLSRERPKAPKARRDLFQHPSKYFLTSSQYFNIYRNMKKPDAVAALAALAQDNRLDVFRLLVEAGPQGMAAGSVADALKLAPNTLTFHFDRLRDAGLVTVRREGRSMIYAAHYDTMNALLDYLTENCCQGRAEDCTPPQGEKRRARRKECVT
jgi:DNA-binding transcriptional ArsR family regulator